MGDFATALTGYYSKDWQFVLTEASLIERFYEKLFNAISDAFFSEINNAKSSIPEKGNKRFLKVFTWFYYEMLKLNKDGARVLLKGKIDFAEHHYETECTVRWNESLSETAIKNASITSVVDSQEKELAAAI